MGLGKTLTLLALIYSHPHPVLGRSSNGVPKRRVIYLYTDGSKGYAPEGFGTPVDPKRKNVEEEEEGPPPPTHGRATRASKRGEVALVASAASVPEPEPEPEEAPTSRPKRGRKKAEPEVAPPPPEKKPRRGQKAEPEAAPPPPEKKPRRGRSAAANSSVVAPAAVSPAIENSVPTSITDNATTSATSTSTSAVSNTTEDASTAIAATTTTSTESTTATITSTTTSTDSTSATNTPVSPDYRPISQTLYDSRATLVVCPSHLCAQWYKEVEKYFTPGMSLLGMCFITYSVARFSEGILRHHEGRSQPVDHRDGPYVGSHHRERPVSRGKFNGREFEHKENTQGKWYTEDSGSSRFKADMKDNAHFIDLTWFHWHRVVLDEGHEVDAREVAGYPCNSRWLLSGTPFAAMKEVVSARVRKYLMRSGQNQSKETSKLSLSLPFPFPLLSCGVVCMYSSCAWL